MNAAQQRLNQLEKELQELQARITADDNTMTTQEMDARNDFLCWMQDNAEELAQLKAITGA